MQSVSRHRFQTYMEASEFSEGHLFAYLSVAAAYSHGTEWLDQVVAYIKGVNINGKVSCNSGITSKGEDN